MINLLPPDVKENYHYARKNSYLLKVAAGILIGVVGIVAVTAGGWLFINRTNNIYTGLVNNANQQLKAKDLTQTENQVKAISNNLKLVVQVLSREVLFSQLLQQIGKVLPNGSVLQTLNIAGETGGIDLQVGTVDYQTASQIQVNLADPANKLFSKADIVSIQCQGSGTTNGLPSPYPCRADIRAQFAANNPFLFVNANPSSGSSP